MPSSIGNLHDDVIVKKGLFDLQYGLAPQL